jgi:DNA-binding NarL/FixJ family response regulator
MQLPLFPNRNVLTPRQLQVTACIVQGLTNKETARELKISPRSVEEHRSEIQRRLGVKNAVTLVRVVYQLGGDHVD